MILRICCTFIIAFQLIMAKNIDKIIVFRRFDNLLQANIIKSRLEANGIQCFLSDENMMNLNPLYNQAIGGVKLNIFERDYDEVLKILSTDDSLLIENLPESEVVCPNCQSSNVSYGLSINKKFKLWSIILSFLLFIYPLNTNMVYHCFNCGNEFKKKNKG
jgi:hypothetical protein